MISLSRCAFGEDMIEAGTLRPVVSKVGVPGSADRRCKASPMIPPHYGPKPPHSKP